MGNISRILNLATANSLVLMDELGTSTDPVEGLSAGSSLYQLSVQAGDHD
jgi:DNA mismatch repair ATPase MutS